MLGPLRPLEIQVWHVTSTVPALGRYSADRPADLRPGLVRLDYGPKDDALDPRSIALSCQLAVALHHVSGFPRRSQMRSGSSALQCAAYADKRP